MNALIRLKKTTPVFVIAFVLAWFALSPTAQAVVPPPDGGYPNFNTAEGQKALFSLTTGSANTAVGWYSLFSDTGGSFNTGVGAGTLVLNSGDQNTATGVAALLLNTTGGANTANGALALLNNTGGSFNMANGFAALYSNTAGFANTANGVNALYSNTTGHDNTAVGFQALMNSTGGYNIALGSLAGSGVTVGFANILIGNAGAATDDTNIRIGDIQTATFIAGIRGVTTENANAIPVLIDSAGQLGTQSSSRRFKHEIKPMDKGSESILALKPVTFHYKRDKTSTPQFGLIAEEVAEVNPDLVVHDDNGEIYTVRYEAVNAMLLNEFLKEHRTVQQLKSTVAKQDANAAKQEATIACQQKQIDALIVGLQNVSVQLEAGKPAPQVVSNNQ